MPEISVKIEGLDALINFTKQITIRMPIESNKLNERLAKRTEMAAKDFLYNSYSTKRTVPPTGRLAASILAYQQKPEEWRVKVGGGHILYAMVQEYGKTFKGRKFRPALGYGHSSEGYSVKDESSSITIPEKHFMLDAANETINAADKMVEETANKILR
jgi:hypothetical protein